MDVRMNLSEIAAVKQKAAKVNKQIGVLQGFVDDLQDVDTSLGFTQHQRIAAEKCYKEQIGKLSAERRELRALINN